MSSNPGIVERVNLLASGALRSIRGDAAMDCGSSMATDQIQEDNWSSLLDGSCFHRSVYWAFMEVVEFVLLVLARDSLDIILYIDIIHLCHNAMQEKKKIFYRHKNLYFVYKIFFLLPKKIFSAKRGRRPTCITASGRRRRAP
jgi:hypothetical protein